MNFLKILFRILMIAGFAVIISAALILAPCIMMQRPLVVLTPSMTGSYDKGSMLYVKETEFQELEVGDVITYNTQDGNLVTHRIVNIDKAAGFAITKGDANSTADPYPVFQDAITGKVTFGIPYAGYYIMFLQSPIIIAGLVLIFVGNIVFNFFYNRSVNKKANR